MEPLPQRVCLDLRRIVRRTYKILEDDSWCVALVMQEDKINLLMDIAVDRAIGLVKDGRLRHRDRVANFCERNHYPESSIGDFVQEVTRWIMQELQYAFEDPIHNSGIILRVRNQRGLALNIDVL